MNLFNELKRRTVFRAAELYVVAGWALARWSRVARETARGRLIDAERGSLGLPPLALPKG